MDLHVYRNSQDRWHDLRSAARERGAVLAVNATTLDELVERLTPDVKTATPGQRLAVLETLLAVEVPRFPNLTRYVYDAVGELKSARVQPAELRASGEPVIADYLENYNEKLLSAGLCDPQDRRAVAALRVKELSLPWLRRFGRVVLHALYDLSEADFLLIRSLIEALPDGGTVILFNTTVNVKPTQFAEWTWQRFVQDDVLAEKTVPEFCRQSQPNRAILERLFVFTTQEPLQPDDSIRIVQASGRYDEVRIIGSDIADLLTRGEVPNDIAVVVRNIEMYGEMIDDAFTRYGIPHSFETGIPLLRIPFIKYWLSLLDLVTSERSREALARVMSSAYFRPRLSPKTDVDRVLAGFGYIDRHHLRASDLAARKNSPIKPELDRFENFLNELEASDNTVAWFLSRLHPAAPLDERDGQAWRVLAEELQAIHYVRTSPLQNRMSFAEFRKLASEVAGVRTVDRWSAAPVAPGIARVRIMSPHSLGYREYKWIFAPGFADGEFPAASVANPLLPDNAIEAINKRIRPRRLMTSRDRNRKEPLYLFTILDSAVNRVTITYPGSTLEGNTIYPSVYIKEMMRHYAEPVVSTAYSRSGASAPLLAPRAEGEWLCSVASEWRRGMLHDERARQFLGNDIVERARLELKGIARANLSRGSFPAGRVWHPSELNSLQACPFVFLAAHAMRLRRSEVPEFEVPIMEIGIIVHAILRAFYMEPVPDSVAAARRRMNDIITRRLAAPDIDGQGPYSVFDPSLWKIRREQVVSVLNEYVRFAVRDASDGFETVLDYLDSPLPAAEFGEVLLAGRPDHVAVHRTGDGIDTIRIDDFKYSAASNSTATLLKESFQVPIYAYLARLALKASDTVRLEGRYLLLRSPGKPVVSYMVDEAVSNDFRLQLDGLMQKVREGKFSPDPADKQDCADCQYRRLCRLHGG